MGKSLDFVYKRYENDYLKFEIPDGVKMVEVGTQQYIKTMQDYIERAKNEGFVPNFNIAVEFDENADFEYVSTETVVCDGTLWFVGQCIESIIQKITLHQTCNINKMNPEIFNKSSIYNVKYTIGNFVLMSECGDFGTEEKPWLHSRYTVMLPIKYEVYECKSN